MKKDIKDRLSEVVSIRKKLDLLGLTKQYPEIKAFHEILSKYVKNGESSSGKVRIPNTDRLLQYVLPSRARNQCSVTLLYNK